MTPFQFRLAVLGLLLASGLAGAAGAAAPTPAPPLYRPSAQPPSSVADWLTRYTSIKPDTVVSVGDEYIVAVLSSAPADPANPKVLKLEIRGELTDPDAETARQLRSLFASLEINCADHTSHFIEVRTYAAANLKGAEQVSRPAEGWVPNPQGSYFEDIDKAVCQPGTPRPLVLAANQNAAPAPSHSAPTHERPAPALRPAQATDAPLPKAAAPTPKPAAEATPAPPKPKPAPAAPAARAGGAVQIAAGARPAKAQEALDALRKAEPGLMGGLSTRIEPVTRDGATLYRALVYGFAAPTTPASFCRQLSAAGRACLVR
jgi:hypothetical protein